MSNETLRCSWPGGDILNSELPRVGQDVHVGGESPVVGVAGDAVCQEVNVPVPQPGDGPVAEVGDGAHHPDVLAHHGPHHPLALAWARPSTTAHFSHRTNRTKTSLPSPPQRAGVVEGFLYV